MHVRGTWLGCLALASLVVCGGCEGGGGSGSGAGGGGEGGQGGEASNLPVPEVIGEALELTGAGLDLVGNPVMGAGQAGFAVAWVKKISPYLEGQGVVVPADGSAPSVYFGAGSDSAPDVIRASEDGSSFGMAEAASGGTFEGDAFWLSTVAAAGGGGELQAHGLEVCAEVAGRGDGGRRVVPRHVSGRGHGRGAPDREGPDERGRLQD